MDTCKEELIYKQYLISAKSTFKKNKKQKISAKNPEMLKEKNTSQVFESLT